MSLILGMALAFPLTAQPDNNAAAPSPPDTAAPAEPGELETSDQTVKIKADAEDEQIAGRLRRILDASGRYENLAVSVRDGIVFLEGTTTQEDYRAWASDLAGRTEDVVAVVNNLELDPPPVLEQDAVTDQLGELWNNFYRALPLIGIGLLILLVSAVLAKLIGRVIN
ncbi:MAG: BON domain-containing protein, partial [Planctomycetota bacterium]